MYKTIVVEDEADVREAIIATIDWEQHGFTVVGEAANGREALDLIEKAIPDLVITDIKMPFMDGIQLATAIREQSPVTKIVFLSGFNQFDYAVSALKLNVVEYILKPVSRQELSGALDNIRAKLDAEERQARDIAMLTDRFDKDRTILKNSFLISLIKGSPSPEEIAHKVERYDVRLTGESFLLFTISIDRNCLEDSQIQTHDMELLLLSATGVAKTLGEKYLGVEDFIYEENGIVLLSDTQENIRQYAPILIQEVRQHIHKYGGFSVTIGVSRPFSGLEFAREAYNDSISAIHYRLAGGGGRIIHIGDFERGQEFILSDAQGTLFHSMIKTGSKEEISQFLAQLFSQLQASRASLKSYQLCFVELFSQLIKAAKNASEDLDVQVGDNLSYMSELYKRDSVAEIRSWFEGLCHQVMDTIAQQRMDTADILAQRATDYIRANYTNSDLSLKSLSDALHVSSSYLSTIIKKAKGEAFTNLLTRVRMEMALELLISTNKTIQEIAEQTGYADRHYFSYCFKKYHDLSPVQMRNRQKTEREAHEDIAPNP